MWVLLVVRLDIHYGLLLPNMPLIVYNAINPAQNPTGSDASVTPSTTETLPSVVYTDYAPPGGTTETLPTFVGTDYAVTGTITHDVVLATTGTIYGAHMVRHNIVTSSGAFHGAHIQRNFSSPGAIGAFQKPLILAGMIDLGFVPGGTF